MLDQVIQTRVDQQMAALIGAVRSAVSGNTGLNQGQTALAVVQVPQAAASQNQNPGSGTQTASGNGGQGGQAGSGNAATQTAQGQSGTPQTTPGGQTTASNTAAATLLQAASAGTQVQATTQAAAQALVNQVNAQTAAAMAAAVAAGTVSTRTGSASGAPGQPLANNGQPSTGSQPQAAASTPASANTGSVGSTAQAQGAIQAQNSAQTASQIASSHAASQTPQSSANSGAAAATQPLRVLIQQTGQTVELPQLKPLPAGTQITLRQAGDAQVDILKVQLPPATAAQQNQAAGQNQTQRHPNAVLQQVAMTALRESLPVQRPVTETLTTLQNSLPQLPASLKDSPGIQQALQIIDKATLKVSTEGAPSAQAVRQSIQRSGVFHEAVMMQALQQAALPQGAAIAPVGDDLKGAFFQIFRQLTRSGSNSQSSGGESTQPNRTATAETRETGGAQVLRSLQEGLARIRSNQLHSSRATRGAEGSGAAPAIQTDLPIMFNHQLSEVKVKIEQEIWPEEQQPVPGEDYQRRWVINLTFSPPELGRLHARLVYQQEKLSTHIWVEQDEQLPGVSKQLHELKERLTAIGVVLDEVRCQAGVPPQAPEPGVLSLKA